MKRISEQYSWFLLLFLFLAIETKVNILNMNAKNAIYSKEIFFPLVFITYGPYQSDSFS